MSNCWKCGRGVPEGQVECEPVCGVSANADPIQAARNGNSYMVNFKFTPDPSKIQTPGEEMMFRRAFSEWMMSIARSFSRSGLNTFCKNIPPDEND
jgi:hypothetical protein